jgi:hypothetical protein
MVLINPNGGIDSLTLPIYTDIANRYFANASSYWSINGNTINQTVGNTTLNKTEEVKNMGYELYFMFYISFTNETNYAKPASITLVAPYICPLTVDSVNNLYTQSATLNTLATKFRNDVSEGKNRNSANYSANASIAYSDAATPTNFSDSATDGSAPTNSQQEKFINGYKQLVFMTDALIYELWNLMKSPITYMATYSGSVYTNSSLGDGLTNLMTASNMIQVGGAGTIDDPTFYNFGFNHDTDAKNILKTDAYKNYKKYVSFARDTLNALMTHPQFTSLNNQNTYLPNPASDHSLVDTLKMGVSALTASLAAFETTYDSRYNVGGKYDKMNTNRDDINAKLKDLNHFPGTSVYNANQQYSATMVAGTFWAVLASGLIYYVFTEL